MNKVFEFMNKIGGSGRASISTDLKKAIEERREKEALQKKSQEISSDPSKLEVVNREEKEVLQKRAQKMMLDAFKPDLGDELINVRLAIQAISLNLEGVEDCLNQGADVNAILNRASFQEGGSGPCSILILFTESLVQRRQELLYNTFESTASLRLQILKVAERLMVSGANPNDFVSINQDSAFHLACKLSLVEVANVLLEHGADMHKVGASNLSALECWAYNCANYSQEGLMKTISILPDQGIDLLEVKSGEILQIVKMLRQSDQVEIEGACKSFKEKRELEGVWVAPSSSPQGHQNHKVSKRI